MRGRFIVLEGLDGSGTTTQLSRVAEWLRSRSVAVEVTKEPSNGPFGAVLRQAIEGRTHLDAATLALAFAADRTDHVFNDRNGVEQALAQGRWVLCDRYLLSNIAYQVGGDITEAWIREINRHAIEPDVTVFVDTEPTTCVARITARSANRELFDDLTVLERTLQAYRTALTNGGTGHLVTVDGNGTPDEVFGRITAALDAWWPPDAVG